MLRFVLFLCAWHSLFRIISLKVWTNKDIDYEETWSERNENAESVPLIQVQFRQRLWISSVLTATSISTL